MKSALGILFCSLSVVLQVHAQGPEIRAQIVDSTNLAPVSFTTVYIDVHTGTISDEEGFFRLHVSPEKLDDSLHVSCIGYHEKMLAVRDLDTIDVDTIYLQPAIIELAEVEVAAKGGRTPRPERIIRRAIRHIPDNYPEEPVRYTGYYREYSKQQDTYINLFESIIDLWDPGFGSDDNFQAGLRFKRINRDFPVDSALMQPYDNYDKFVPLSYMPITLNNELVILRAHDPVRNFDRKSFYFIDRMKKDFIRHHDFDKAKLTWLNDRPYYYITFRDHMNYAIRNNKVTADGEIYVEALDYGIRRIRYRASVDKGGTPQKLFEVNLEYTPSNQGYLLHYLSFNNLFYTRNFFYSNPSIFRDKLELMFSKPYDPSCATPEHIAVYLQGQKQEIQDIETRQTSLALTFAPKSPITDMLRINILPRNMQTRKNIAENERILLNDLHIEFRNFRDENGNELADKKFNEYYQYREFFTDSTSLDREGITSNLVDKSRPVIDNRIFGGFSGDTTRMNTPLISEQVLARPVYEGNTKLSRFVSGQLKRNENLADDIAYIHTDREVYAPEDTLWFKAYIRDKKTLGTSDLSRLFYVMLADLNGSVVDTQKYLVTGSAVHGQMILDNSLEEGRYYLLGYSSWMTNFDPEDMFCKQILVMKEKRDNLLLATEFDKTAYFPGDTVRMLVNCYDEFNREVSDVNFNYRFAAGIKILMRGRGSTDRSWLEPVVFVVPPALDTTLEVQLRSSYKLVRLDTAYIIPVDYSVRMDFFPEGGHCINGTRTVLAFMAVDEHGDPVDVSGEVIDEKGKVVTKAASVHDGMGSIPYKPEVDRTFYFQLNSPEGFKARFPLPEGVNNGWQMNVQNENDNQLGVEIRNLYTGNDTALITLSVRGYLCYYHLVVTPGKESVFIPLSGIPPGVGVLTLLDHNLLPRAERLVWIPPGHTFDPEIRTDRQRYLTRDSVIMSIGLNGGPVAPGGSYSLSVFDEQLGATPLLDEPDIETSLLVSPEIRGKIHDPEHYIDRSDPRALADLDLLLMTQGWRNYRIEEKPNIAKPENRDGIAGRLLKQPFGSDKIPAEGQLSVFFGGNTAKIHVGEDGKFSFLPDYSMEYNSDIILAAKDKRGSGNLSIVLKSNYFEETIGSWLDYLADSLDKEPLNYGTDRARLQDRFSLALENHQWLEEVTIRKTVEKKQLEPIDLAFNTRKATREELEMAFDMEDMANMVRMPNPHRYPVWYSINDGIPEPGFASNGFGQPVSNISPMIMAILPEDIESYTVVSGMDVQGLYGPGKDYVIAITLKSVSERKSKKHENNPVIVGRLNMVKEFYQPVYDTEEKHKSQIPDLRKTILWEPELKIDAKGEAQVKFYNGDRYTRIRCILEGITGEGIPVHAEHTYEVGLTRE